MAANLLAHLVTPNFGLAYPGWVVVCLIPAYWYGHRVRLVSYAPWEILGTVVVVLAALAVVELWAVLRPFSAVGLAALVCLFFLLRRRLTKREQSLSPLSRERERGRG